MCFSLLRTWFFPTGSIMDRSCWPKSYWGNQVGSLIGFCMSMLGRCHDPNKNYLNCSHTKSCMLQPYVIETNFHYFMTVKQVFLWINFIQAMTKKQKDQQEAIWELLSTEASYISKLYVIKKVKTNYTAIIIKYGKYGGLIVNVLDCGSSSLGSSSSQGTALCSWGNTQVLLSQYLFAPRRINGYWPRREGREE